MRSECTERLRQLGVKDSKLLSPRKRTELATEIHGVAEKHVTLQVAPAEIDHVVLTGRRLMKLNFLEAKCTARIVESLRPDVAYVDAADVDAERYGKWIRDMVSFPVQVISEHKADRNYPIVAAASIIAKTTRDKAIENLREEYGDVGSGYPHDPTTIAFLKKWLLEHGEYPDFVRKSWKTARHIREEILGRQSRLDSPRADG